MRMCGPGSMVSRYKCPVNKIHVTNGNICASSMMVYHGHSAYWRDVPLQHTRIYLYAGLVCIMSNKFIVEHTIDYPIIPF